MTETMAPEKPRQDNTEQSLGAVVDTHLLQRALRCVNATGTKGDNKRLDNRLSLIPDTAKGQLHIRSIGPGGVATAVIPCLTLHGDTATVERVRFTALVLATNSDTIQISAKQRVSIHTGSSKFHLLKHEVEVPIATADPDVTTLSLDMGAIRDSIRRVKSARSKSQAQPILTGLALETKPGEIRFVASDGSRLAVDRLVAPDISDTTQSLLPPETVEALSGLIAGRQGDVTFGISESRLWAYVEQEGNLPEAWFAMPLMSSGYVDYERVLINPRTDDSPVLEATTSIFQQMVEYARIINEDDSLCLTHISSDGTDTCVLFGRNREGQTELPVSIEMGQAKTVELSFDANFLGDAVKALSTCESVKFKMFGYASDNKTGSPAGAIVYSEDQPSFITQLAACST